MLKKIKQFNVKGFTLIEVLVTVVVISLLVTGVTVFLGGARQKTSDFERMSAIEDIRDALFYFYEDLGYYPDALLSGQPIINPENGNVYLASVPEINTAQDSSCTFVGFNYNSTEGGEYYVINYCLSQIPENETSGDVIANPDDTVCTPECSGKECEDDNGCGSTCEGYCMGTVVVTLPSEFICGEDSVSHGGINYETVLFGDECWLDRNLGASRVALSINDELSYGDYYQWGRLTDGHEKNNTLVTGKQSSLINPGHNKFIIPVTAGCIGYSCRDWLKEEDNNLWQGVDGLNNPCPTGWRIPTLLEWTNSSTGLSNIYDFYEATLKVSGAGYRVTSTGDLVSGFANTRFWTSTTSDKLYEAKSVYISMLNSDFAESNYRVAGFPVRCIKD